MALLVGLFAAGLTAGTLGALLGLGGGIFLVPLLAHLFGYPLRYAVGASLVSVLATSAAVAAAEKKGRVADVSLGLRLEIATAAGAVLAGWVAAHIPVTLLGVGFAIVAFGTAWYTLRAHGPRASAEAPSAPGDYQVRRWKIGYAAASLAGAASGLFGVGGGFLKVPVMQSVMGVPLPVATATSNFMIGITAAASVFVYLGRGDVLPLVAVPTALGVLLGATLGVRLQSHIAPRLLRWSLAVLLVVLGAQVLLQGFRPV